MLMAHYVPYSGALFLCKEFINGSPISLAARELK